MFEPGVSQKFKIENTVVKRDYNGSWFKSQLIQSEHEDMLGPSCSAQKEYMLLPFTCTKE